MSTRLLAWTLFVLACLPAVAQQVSPATPSSEGADSLTTRESSNKGAPGLDLTPGQDGKLSQEQMQELFRIVADKDMENNKRERDYTYTEREVQSNLDGKGHTKSTEIKTYEILEIAGEQVQRLIAKDDKPLNAKDAAKEDEKSRNLSTSGRTNRTRTAANANTRQKRSARTAASS